MYRHSIFIKLSKQLPLAVLVMALAMQTLNRGCIVWSYYVNTAAYAKSCENKARPQMHCNGRCQMMKKLKQEQKKDERAPERKTVNDEVISSKSFFTTYLFTRTGALYEYASLNHADPTDMPDEFFHPPGLV